MIKQEQLDKLKELGIDVQQLVEAYTAEQEQDITIPEGKLYKEADLEARDSNMRSEGKRLGVQEGKDAMKEIANKMIFEKFGVKDLDKKEDISKVLDVAVETSSKGDESLKSQIKDLLSDKEKLEVELEKNNQEKERFSFRTTMLSNLPKNRSDILSDDEYISIIESNIEEIDGKKGIKLNGQVLKDDTTKEILSIDKGISRFFESRDGWLKKEEGGGRGGQDDPRKSGGGIKTYSQALEKFTKDNPDKDATSPEFTSYLTKVVREEPSFNMDE